MAFAIRENGERSKVAAYIKTIVEMGAENQPLKDQSFIDSVKADILADIASLSKEYAGVLVIAEGRENENSRQRSIQVIGQKGHY